MFLYKDFFNRDATKVEQQGQQNVFFENLKHNLVKILV